MRHPLHPPTPNKLPESPEPEFEPLPSIHDAEMLDLLAKIEPIAESTDDTYGEGILALAKYFMRTHESFVDRRRRLEEKDNSTGGKATKSRSRMIMFLVNSIDNCKEMARGVLGDLEKSKAMQRELGELKRKVDGVSMPHELQFGSEVEAN